MTIDRAVLAFAGFMVLLSVALTVWVSPLFVWLTVFVGLNLLQSSYTGFCPAAVVSAARRRPGPPSEASDARPRPRRQPSATAASAGTLTLAPEAVTEWKPIYGTVAPRNDVPARARIGGVVEELPSPRATGRGGPADRHRPRREDRLPDRRLRRADRRAEGAARHRRDGTPSRRDADRARASRRASRSISFVPPSTSPAASSPPPKPAAPSWCSRPPKARSSRRKPAGC